MRSSRRGRCHRSVLQQKMPLSGFQTSLLLRRMRLRQASGERKCILQQPPADNVQRSSQRRVKNFP
jgi:hypothetical protein